MFGHGVSDCWPADRPRRCRGGQSIRISLMPHKHSGPVMSAKTGERATLSILRSIPLLVRGYLAVVVALSLLAIPINIAYQAPPPRNGFVGALLSMALLLLVLGSAWLGYGPGLLACLLTCFALPWFMPRTNRSFQTNLLAFGVLSCISVLVSRVADVGRKHRAVLMSAAEELEAKVRQRTDELTNATREVRHQAQLVDLAHDAILALDLTGVIQFWSAGAERMYGWPKQEALGKISHDLLRTKFPEPLEAILRKVVEVGHWEGELTHQRRDATQLRVLSRWTLRPAEGTQSPGILEINTDITARRKIEEQLRTTQRIESLGVLAGGVAHDFNNLLTGIMGNTSLALDTMTPSDPKYVFVQDALRAAERAADLTRQLLAYAGKGRYVLQIIDTSALVREIAQLVKTSIPKTVQLRLQLAEGLPAIEADPGQLQQVVMNLIINGAEAIGPEGGTVVVQTAVQDIDEQYIGTLSTAGEDLRPGSYVMLEVHDTGCGMDEETMGKIFEPFFTTKFTGRGLGLSAVLGIIQAHRGALKVYSKPGQGTTFKVLLPSVTAEPGSAEVGPVVDLTGHGTVLIVDDEEVVRRTAVHTLKRYGYEPVIAANGAEAVELFRRDPNSFAVVLLDLTMPVMGGEETLRQLRILNADIRVILSSGFNEVEAIQHFTGKGLAGFIQKPYTSLALAEKIHQVLA
jgi:PAS domain S-box-containing protein